MSPEVPISLLCQPPSDPLKNNHVMEEEAVVHTLPAEGPSPIPGSASRQAWERSMSETQDSYCLSV